MKRQPRFDTFAPTSDGILTAPEICNQDLEPLKWLIEGVVPLEGVTMLIAPPKIGKSTLVLNIILENAMGLRVLSYFRKQEPLDILYIDLEGTSRRSQKMMGGLLRNNPIPPNLSFAYKWPKIYDGGLSKLYDYATYHPDTRLIVIDTLGKIQPDSNKTYSYKEDVKDIDTISRFCKAMGVSVFLIHHTRKADSGDWVAMASGTHGISGSVDTILFLERSRRDFHGILRVTGRDVEDNSYKLNMNFSKSRMNVIGLESDERTELTDAQSDIVICLQAYGEPMSPTDISDTIGKTVGSVKRLLANMVEDGKILRVGYGKYCDRLR